jgi:hypothetical protein
MDRNLRVLVMGATAQVRGAFVNHLRGIEPMIFSFLCSAACTVRNGHRYAGGPHKHALAKKSHSVEQMNHLERL